MSELKPCPKCNGEASIEYENYDYDGGDWWLIREADVVCQECGLVFHAENESREHQQGEHCLDFIIEAWNTRADDYKQAAEYWQRMYEESFTERTCRSTTDDAAWCFVCSECGKSFPRDKLHLAYHHGEINYCPNCGAKVVG